MAATSTRLQRMKEAALWLQRLHEGTVEDDVLHAWLDWCQCDPLNQQVFDELAEIWEMSGKLPRPR
jgi:ferric-dicitrate binding protein FerR (iron transport regulator)